MATNWQGYLMKSGNNYFPDKYIKAETYKATPNQREEIEAYRDDYTRDLSRTTASGTKTKIVFNTVDELTLEQKMEIQNFFNANMTDSLQRKFPLAFWNDETNEYCTGRYFYIADIEYTINRFTPSTIIYNSLKYTLVEY